jgi:hypothetical protein
MVGMESIPKLFAQRGLALPEASILGEMMPLPEHPQIE